MTLSVAKAKDDQFVLTEYVRLLALHRITHLFLVPPMVILLLKHQAAQNADLTSVQHVMVGAAPLDGGTLAAFRKRLPGVPIGQGCQDLSSAFEYRLSWYRRNDRNSNSYDMVSSRRIRLPRR